MTVEFPVTTEQKAPGVFRRLKIRHKLLLSYSALVLVATLLCNVAVYALVSHTIRSNIADQLESTTEAIVEMVSSSAQAAVRNRLRTVANIAHEAAKYFLEMAEQGTMPYEMARREAERVMLRLRIGESGYIYCLNSRGILEVHPKEGLQQADISSFGFIQDQLQRKDGYLEYEWQNPDDTELRPKALYMKYFEPWDWIISASSYRTEFNTLLDVSDFHENILALRFGETGYPYILDGAGNIVVHPTLSGNVFDVQDSNGRYFIREICATKNGTLTYTWQNPGEKGFREKLAVFRYLPEFDWIVVAASYSDEFSRPLVTVRNTFVATALITLLLLIPITVMISSTITRPITELGNRLQRGADGDLSVRVTPESDDEVGRLARYFNLFMSRIEKGLEEREKLEKERVRMAARLRQSEKMEAVGQLAGGVAHDFNNILAVIIGHADLLPKQDLGPDDRVAVDEIITAAERASRLTRTLLDFSRSGSVHSTVVDVHDLIGEAVDLLGHTIDKRIVIEVRTEANRHLVLGDPARLRNTLLNLALNARDAMAGGGKLLFRTTDIKETEVEGLELQPNSLGFLKISISDTGSGIEPKTLDKVFEPFFTTKKTGEGSGLGLASAYGCVQGHGGTIEVNSVVDVGTAVDVYLPLAEPDEPVAEPVKDIPPTPVEGRILVVDDEESVRAFAEVSLQRLGFETIGCGDGAEAVELFAAQYDRISLVLLDFVMPRMSGPQALEEMLKIDPGVRVVMCSGFAQGVGLDAELPAEVAAFLDKPYRLDDLSRVVSEVLSRNGVRHQAE